MSASSRTIVISDGRRSAKQRERHAKKPEDLYPHEARLRNLTCVQPLRLPRARA